MDETELIELNRQIRADILAMLHECKSGHPGGSLSCVEIIATLYFQVMRIDPRRPGWEERDRFVLSKGHAAPTLYAVLARQGFFPTAELLMLRKLGSRLQGHPDMRKTPGVDASTGSLGQGVSIAVGMALGAKLKQKTYQVYAVLGDGEMQEGEVWEAAMAASHYHLDNLTLILDYNRLQIDGPNDQVMSLGDIGQKMAAFGFAVSDVDGHSVRELRDACTAVAADRPKFIIAHTVKGKGVSFMENQLGWHGKAPGDEETTKALSELRGVC